MKRSLSHFFVAILIWTGLVGCYTGYTRISEGITHTDPDRITEFPLGELSTEQAIARMESLGTSDPIEGVWGQSQGFVMAILRNTSSMFPEFDYMGIVTNPRASKRLIGQEVLYAKALAGGG